MSRIRQSMKKEKTVRSYKRKTKSGKVVTVKQHTAKYDAAEAFKEALAKKGAGSELATKQLTEKELKQVQDIAEENSELDEEYLAAFYPELSPKMVKAVMAAHKAKSATPKAKAANTAGKSPKSETPDLGFTAEEYKAWYHWDMDKDPKNPSALKVKKALVAAMGPRAYRKYEDDMTDSYTARGDKKAFGAVGELVQARKDARNAKSMEKLHKGQKALAENLGAKDAAEKFDAKAKEQGAKKKEAQSKIGVLSPKDSLSKKGAKSNHKTGETSVGSLPDVSTGTGRRVMVGKRAYYLRHKDGEIVVENAEGKVMKSIHIRRQAIEAYKRENATDESAHTPRADSKSATKKTTSKKKEVLPKLPKTATAYSYRSGKKEKVNFVGTPVKDEDAGSGYLALGKFGGGRMSIFMSDDGKSWQHADGWNDGPLHPQSSAAKLLKQNGYKAKLNRADDTVSIVPQTKPISSKTMALISSQSGVYTGKVYTPGVRPPIGTIIPTKKRSAAKKK